MRIMSYFFGQMRFQSTPSTRRVTIQPLFVPPIKIISIHTLHTEGDHTIPYAGAQIDISIHTLHTEGDHAYPGILGLQIPNFNPHPPHGG